MMPDRNTVFRPLKEIEEYCNDNYFCSAIVFSPETENNHFSDCPPYIQLNSVDDFSDEGLFFEVPKIIAYFGTEHAGYTMKGNKIQRERGKEELAIQLRNLLNIK